MEDLGTVKDDYASVLRSARSKARMISLSIDEARVPRAFLWRNIMMINLDRPFCRATPPSSTLRAEDRQLHDDENYWLRGRWVRKKQSTAFF